MKLESLSNNELRAIYALHNYYSNRYRPSFDWGDIKDPNEKKRKGKEYQEKMEKFEKDWIQFVRTNIDIWVEHIERMNEIKSIPKEEITPDERGQLYVDERNIVEKKLIFV